MRAGNWDPILVSGPWRAGPAEGEWDDGGLQVFHDADALRGWLRPVLGQKAALGLKGAFETCEDPTTLGGSEARLHVGRKRHG